MKIFVLLLMLIVISHEAKSQSGFSDYYITLQNDTLYQKLETAFSRYLVYHNSKGRQRKFTPSMIKGFHINSIEYVPLYLKDFDSKFFVSVRGKGSISLFKYDCIDQHYSGMPGGALPGAFIGMQMARVSGYYMKKQGDSTLYSIPAKEKFFIEFMDKHFADNLEIIEKVHKKEYSIKDIEQLISEYNIGTRKN